MVLSSVVPKIVATGSHATPVPSVNCHVHCLCGVRLDGDCVFRALTAAVVEASCTFSRIVKHEEVVRRPASYVVSEVGPCEGRVVEVKGHKEYTIVIHSVPGICLVLIADGVPFFMTIAPLSGVHLTRPRVAHLDKFVTIFGCENAKDGVRMTQDQAIFIIFSVITSIGVHLDEV